MTEVQITDIPLYKSIYMGLKVINYIGSLRKGSVPINSSAASITAAPFNMVAMRMSWPGQSTNET